MPSFANVIDGIVLTVVDLPTKPSDYYPPVLAENYITCSPDVEANWLYDGTKFYPPIVPLIDLAAVKTQAKREIDAQAEAERLKYITPGAGQAMTYQQKVDEARSFMAASNPEASDYLILSSEVGITAETLSEVADVVLAAFAQWQQIGAAIEAIRLGAKRDINAAQDEAAARVIVDEIEWPQLAL